jgi:perosamine synthetase
MTTAVRPIQVPQFRSFVDHDDFAALEKVFCNGYIAEGPFAREFHAKLLQMIGAPHGVFACNGTLAIYLALKALGIGRDDEVIVQDITFIASANAVEMVGATPVFVDIPAYNDFTIDLNRIVLTPRTKGIVVAHLFGTACRNIEEVQGFCKEHELFLIEDAAQALGITDGQHCGTFGDVGTFSFYADKTITTAEGGFVVTRDPAIFERMTYLRNQGRKQSGTFVHPEIGYNFRITDLQAALGLSQLTKFEQIRHAKLRLYEAYREQLEGVVELLLPHPDFTFIPFRVIAFVEDAERTMASMRYQGIEPRSIFYPLHAQPCYQNLGYHDTQFPHAMESFRRGICLPTWVGLTQEQIDLTCAAICASI